MKKIYATMFILSASAAAFLISMCAGSRWISPAEIINLVMGYSNADTAILLYMRLPRVCAAFITGASLGVSGALFQSLLKNPLADPYTLGVSGGASLGAAAAIILALPYSATALISLAGAAAAIALIYMLSRRFNAGENTVIIAGIGISIVLSSAVMLLFALAESHRVHKALLWLMGDLSLARFDALGVSAAAVAVLIAASLYYRPHLNLLSYGTDYAHAAGISKNDIRGIFLIASFLAAISVSLAGVIGFIGLIVPHLVRALAGHDNRSVVPLSAAAGGAFLACCDAIGRSAAYPYEIPGGVVTGFCGGIFLMILLFTGKRP